MDEEIKRLIELSRKELKGLILNEDKEFLNALLADKIETKEHKDKLDGIKDLIKRMEQI